MWLVTRLRLEDREYQRTNTSFRLMTATLSPFSAYGVSRLIRKTCPSIIACSIVSGEARVIDIGNPVRDHTPQVLFIRPSHDLLYHAFEPWSVIPWLSCSGTNQSHVPSPS